jgi:hypothetical protein
VNVGQIITFYSYKGGVGRSMVLANVGHIMAWQMSSQHKVLMIDWDLEAPGLHKFFKEELKSNFHASGSLYLERLQRAPGLINFLHDVHDFYQSSYPKGELAVMYAETEAAQTAFKRAIDKYPLEKYILTVAPPVFEDGKSDRLFLMKAGDQASDDFINIVRTFRWQEFFDRYGSFFTLLCEHLAAKYDAVLIDSRTGLTDIGDICTRLMPDKLVGVFVPNEQNIEGLTRVLRGSAEFRKNSRDPREMIIFPLASRIDPSRGQLRRAWWKGGVSQNRKITGYEPQFEQLIATVYELDKCDLDAFFDSTQVPHDADYAFGEEVAARDPSSGRLGIGYSCTKLTEYLSDDRVPWEPLLGETAPAVPTPVNERREFVPAALRSLLALAMFMVGAALAVFAPSFFESSAPVTKPYSGGQIILSSSSVAGFGMGQITITGHADKANLADVPDLILRVSRGSLDRNVINAASPNSSAVLTSAGLGPAILNVTFPGGAHYSLEPIQVQFGWPTAIFAAAAGGAFAGAALRLRNYGSPSYPLADRIVYKLVNVATSFLFGLLLVGIYVLIFAPLIVSDYRFSTKLIALIAAVGALGFPVVRQGVLAVLVANNPHLGVWE